MERFTRSATLGLTVLVCVFVLRAQTVSSPAPAAPPPADVLTVPTGEQIVLQLEDSLHTRHSHEGDRAEFTTVREVLDGYRIAIPPGSTVRATLTKVKRPGRLSGRAEIRLRFDEVVLPDCTTLPFAANILRAGFARLDEKDKGLTAKGESNKTRDLTTIGLGGAQGAILGAAIGGKKGAGYGGAIGAGIGLLSVLLERGPELDLPRGMLFEVELDQPVEVPAAVVARWNQPPGQPGAAPPAAAPAAGGFKFPSDGDAAESYEPPPDFGPDESAPATPEATPPATATTESAPPDLTSPPGAALPPPTPPLPPSLDPTLGDPGAYRMRMDVQLVLVEAFVRDVHGTVVEDLTRDDFQVLEDGVPQEIRHFSRDELPLAVALVVDRSGSVAPYMRELRQAAYETLSQLKPGDQVALFAFGSDVERLEDLTTDRRRIAESIARIRAGGGTNITDALFDAVYYLSLAAPDRRRAIILISDNEATQRGRSSQSQAIRMALETGVVVYSIKTPGDSLSPLQKLSVWTSGVGSVRRVVDETGGEIIDVKRTGSLEAALATVISRLKTRYTLGYQSTNAARDGTFRRIDVQLADRFGRPELDYSVHARRGYYAPTDRVASGPQPADDH